MITDDIRKVFKGNIALAPLILMLLIAFPIGTATAQQLVLWNKLGSDAEVLNSAFGPNLAFYVGGCGLDVEGDSTYVAGQFGNAVTLAQSACPPYSIFQRIHNIVLPNLPNHLDPEKGAIEAWYKQNVDPVPFSHGVYRIFGGSFGLGSGMSFQSSPGNLIFSLAFGGTGTTVLSSISPNNGQFIHIAGVWDRNGIDNTLDAIRLYVDGVQVAATTGTGWGTTVGQTVDMVGGNDANILNKFFVDNLKIWNCPKTDYSDRFNEASTRGCVTPVDIDIKPGSDPNCFDIDGHGVIPVAILGSADFDVSEIDDTTLALGGFEVRMRGNKGPLCTVELSNNDSFSDLVCHFEDEGPSNWTAGNATATLTGNLLDADETPIEGTDSICIVP